MARPKPKCQSALVMALIEQAAVLRKSIADDTHKLAMVEEALRRRGNTCYEEDTDADTVDRTTDSD